MASKSFLYHVRGVTFGERDLLAMVNADGMTDAVRAAGELIPQFHRGLINRIEIERCSDVASATRAEIARHPYDFSKSR